MHVTLQLHRQPNYPLEIIGGYSTISAVLRNRMPVTDDCGQRTCANFHEWMMLAAQNRKRFVQMSSTDCCSTLMVPYSLLQDEFASVPQWWTGGDLFFWGMPIRNSWRTSREMRASEHERLFRHRMSAAQPLHRKGTWRNMCQWSTSFYRHKERLGDRRHAAICRVCLLFCAKAHRDRQPDVLLIALLLNQIQLTSIRCAE